MYDVLTYSLVRRFTPPEPLYPNLPYTTHVMYHENSCKSDLNSSLSWKYIKAFGMRSGGAFSPSKHSLQSVNLSSRQCHPTRSRLANTTFCKPLVWVPS